MSATRKLVTIFYADVAGYSRLTGMDEEGTHRRVMELLDGVTQNIGASGGTVLRYAGDAVLATFPSVVQAIDSSASIQTKLAGENSGLPDGEQVQIRIGINLGDVIEDRGEVYGDGVNLAARLESAAVPGGICISAAVHDQIDGKVGIDFQDGGDSNFKNIARPIRVWHWPASPEDLDVANSDSVPGETKQPSIAILPFTNMSDDPDQEYFSDGLTEDIITALSQWRSIPVIARNSVFTYKVSPVPAQQVAEDLGVQYVMEGSVRKAGNRLRITAQLIDANSGHHVWAEKFDRQLEDIFDVQDEITNHIAAIIVPELESFENRRSTNKPTEDLNAWDHYLRGMAIFNDETCAGTAAAMKMFQSALDIDPNYSDAWARLSWCYAKEVMFDCNDDPQTSLRNGFEAGRRAVSLDSASALAHLALGTVHIWAEETELGLSEALQAVELNPNFAHAVMAAGNRLDLVGRTEEGIGLMEKALILNPRDPIRWRYMAYLSRAYISVEQYQRAADWCQKPVALRPDLPEPLYRHAICLAHLDQIEEAREMLKKCSAIDARYVSSKSNWQPYPDEQRNQHILDGLLRHGLVS
ncbi:MAG: adenylate/guanylate cyclase domain-containing protein [Rhodospirillaceae bacterium]|jgi:adenylate cyclase|nr:adenylate/guanylate cyclase domain-containing protein [Rhodospirillaceae bacterium]MBT5245265.1 adenylate/guanylate cyclase domain-containing protein [Rhodospirillaceae bacterium]MBT5563067.1 adenylate/guanylate cyclase domain-containing protein [Rhodospirillaceae bacterium]